MCCFSHFELYVHFPNVWGFLYIGVNFLGALIPRAEPYYLGSILGVPHFLGGNSQISHIDTFGPKV